MDALYFILLVFSHVLLEVKFSGPFPWGEVACLPLACGKGQEIRARVIRGGRFEQGT